jgi:hypothetical protein
MKARCALNCRARKEQHQPQLLQSWHTQWGKPGNYGLSMPSSWGAAHRPGGGSKHPSPDTSTNHDKTPCQAEQQGPHTPRPAVLTCTPQAAPIDTLTSTRSLYAPKLGRTSGGACCANYGLYALNLGRTGSAGGCIYLPGGGSKHPGPSTAQAMTRTHARLYNRVLIPPDQPC